MSGTISGQQRTIVDNQTPNGVLVNGRPIPPSEEFPIHVGDSIEIRVPENEAGCSNATAPQQHRNTAVSVRTNETAGDQRNLKRKRTTEEEEEEEEEPEPSTPRAKRLRSSYVDRPCPLPVRRHRLIKHLKQTLRQLEQEEVDQPHTGENDTQDLLHMFSQNIKTLKHQLALLEGRHRRRGDQVAEEDKFLQTVHRKIETFEKSLDARSKQLEEQKRKQQQEELLKYQYQEAVREEREAMQEVIDSQQRFGKALLAKNQELKKQKEQAEAQKNQVVADVTGVLENELQCTFCTEFLIETRILNCGHAFCHQCIYLWRWERNFCPVCRTGIHTQTPCKALDNCVDGILEKLSPDLKERRQEVVNHRNSLGIKHLYPNLWQD